MYWYDTTNIYDQNCLRSIDFIYIWARTQSNWWLVYHHKYLWAKNIQSSNPALNQLPEKKLNPIFKISYAVFKRLQLLLLTNNLRFLELLGDERPFAGNGAANLLRQEQPCGFKQRHSCLSAFSQQLDHSATATFSSSFAGRLLQRLMCLASSPDEQTIRS